MVASGARRAGAAAERSARWPRWAPALLANALVLGVLVYAGALEKSSPDFYYQSAQEDEYVEWATFWAFALAAAVSAAAAWTQRRSGVAWPWFLAGVALFSAFVALEEISWGQRLFGYRPPAYFLERNFQQEFNLHNVVDTGYRKLALKGVILGYGVLLPLAALAPPVGRRLRRLAVEPPPAALAPAFTATWLAYEWYPWELTGEWVELMLGGGFLFAALAIFARLRGDPGASPRPGPLALRIAVSWAVVALLGLGTAWATNRLRSGDPEVRAAAEAESRALASDFAALGDACQGKRRVHKRVYSYYEKYGGEALAGGRFAALVAQGLPEDRARYFLDPWNSPYWFQCTRSGGGGDGLVYSFGPDRRRDSSPREVRGDDVGAFLEKPNLEVAQ